MSKIAREIMTRSPQCCPGTTSLTEVAKLMVAADCGEIPIVDSANRLVGVITDRDIVCRAVAAGKDPASMTASSCMSEPVVHVKEDTSIDDVLAVMEENQIRRVPVVDDQGGCCGIISQADIARSEGEKEVGVLVREVSKE